MLSITSNEGNENHKTAMRYHCIAVRMAIMNNPRNNKY